jgi:CMP-N,N'-diacetyllegionaminic acid synthase
MEINYLAIIPARSGSKGLLDKNIKKICEKTLIEIAALNAQKVDKIDGIFFSSDSKEYIKIYKNLNLSKDITKDYIRPKNISDDTSEASEYIIDCLDFLEKNNIKVKNFILLQVTSPLRQYSHINASIKDYESNNYHSLISVNESVNHPCNTLIKKDDVYIPITNFGFTRRQDFANSVTLNGAIYIISGEKYKKTKKFMSDNTSLFFMDKILSIDIDDEQDFYLAEIIYYNLLENKIIEKI